MIRMTESALKPIHIALVVLVVLSLALLSGSTSDSSSMLATEAEFADTSVGGMGIVPASCPSYPHYSYECSCPYPIEGGWDGYGRILYGSYSMRMINAHGVFQCVTNNTGNHIFVPYADYYQLQSFISAANGLGVSYYTPY